MAAIVAAGALMWFDAWFAGALRLNRYIPTLIGTGLGLATLVAACIAVRCPSCGMSLVWHAVSKKPFGAWLEWLLTETTCPKCGFTVTAATSHSQGSK
jgi:endogenous inhibitor of DNA gyrase (YacG/DUF329 family)